MAGHVVRMLLGLAVVAASAGAARTTPDAEPRVVATYFHRTLRCQTCLRIEALARYDVTVVMASDVESGSLVWRLVNFEEAESARFAADYGLDVPSLVVALEAEGEVLRWVRLDRVWEIHDDVEAFDRYVLGALEEYLRDASELDGRVEPSP